MFFVAAGVLLLIFSIVVLYLWSSRADSLPAADEDAAWQVLVGKRNEIEQDVTLSEELKDDLRREWARTADAVLSHDINSAHASSQASLQACFSGNQQWTMLAAVLATALAVYGIFGNHDAAALAWQWNTIAEPRADFSPAPSADATHPGGSDSIEERVAKLERKLQESPNDVDGWVLLARSRGTQRDFAKAADALEHALALAPGHPDLLADLADALAMNADKSLAGRPSALIDQALKADPAHRKALSLAATRAMQQERPAEAADYWRRLRATFPDDAPDVAQIDAILADLGTPTDKNHATQGTQGKAVEGRVTLAPDMLARLRKQGLPDTAILYVLARVPGGSPMPVAVLRLSAQQLAKGDPVSFRLDDSVAPMPAQKLSTQARVDVEARISMRGGAVREAGDMSAVAAGIAPGAGGLHLQIGSVVP
jgi:cytochrome c-type biogenesis protein CcmH